MRTFKNINNLTNSSEIIELIKKTPSPLDNPSDLASFMDYIRDAKYVLLGEAAHGTHEYYTWRAKITQRLIQEKGFSFVGVEGDWPECYRLNRIAKGYLNAGTDVYKVLHEFKRWPTWMWANWEIAAFIDWLKAYNVNLAADKRIGFYRFDVYSFRESMNSIIEYLEKNDPKALAIAKTAMKCFEPYGKDDGQTYARASSYVPELCEKEILNMLKELIKNVPNYNHYAENILSTEQNVFIAKNSENTIVP
jgi:erythromycin esterase